MCYYEVLYVEKAIVWNLKNFALHPAHFARALQPFQLCPCAS